MKKMKVIVSRIPIYETIVSDILEDSYPCNKLFDISIVAVSTVPSSIKDTLLLTCMKQISL